MQSEDANALQSRRLTEAWTRGQTDGCQRGGEGAEGKKGKGAAKEHACLTHGHAQCVVRTQGKGAGAGWTQATVQKWGHLQ